MSHRDAQSASSSGLMNELEPESRSVAELILRPILSDPRIWMIPVIAAIYWFPHIYTFVALPIVIGLIFVVLIVRDQRRADVNARLAPQEETSGPHRG